MRIYTIKLITIVFLALVYRPSANGDSSIETNSVSVIRTAMNKMIDEIGTKTINNSMIDDSLNFNHGLMYNPYYLEFSAAITNQWRYALLNLTNITTNTQERRLVIGTGKVYGEDLYIDYLDMLATLKTNNVISCADLSWFEATTRYDLMSCLVRRYRQSKIVSLLHKLDIALPRGNYWEKIRSGASYTNYLHEVQAGLWGDNPPID